MFLDEMPEFGQHTLEYLRQGAQLIPNARSRTAVVIDHHLPALKFGGHALITIARKRQPQTVAALTESKEEALS